MTHKTSIFQNLSLTFQNLKQGIACLLLVSLPAAMNAHGAEQFQLRLVAAGATSGAFNDDLGLGYGAGLEYRLSDRLGLELGLMDLEVDAGLDFEFGPFSTEVESTVPVQPITLGLNIYLARSERVAFYLTPMVGYASLGDLETSVRGGFGPDADLWEVSKLPLEDTFVFGGRLGLDVDLTARTFLTGAVTSLQIPLEAQDDLQEDAGDLDPLIFQFGVGFRF